MNQPYQQATAFDALVLIKAPANVSRTSDEMSSRATPLFLATSELSNRAAAPDDSALSASERCLADVRRWIRERMSDVTVV